MVKKYFECIIKGHNKFWEITETKKKTNIQAPILYGWPVRYGKINTDSSTRYKLVSISPEIHNHQMNDLTTSKISKRYKQIVKINTTLTVSQQKRQLPGLKVTEQLPEKIFNCDTRMIDLD